MSHGEKPLVVRNLARPAPAADTRIGPEPTADPDTDLAVWRLARRRLFLPVSLLFVALAIVCLAGIRIAEWVQYLPFAVGMIALGLPHGALDHLVPARLAGRAPTVRTVAPVVALYGALGAAVIALWWVAPALAFVFFIGLTWVHWGQGDLFVLGRRREHPAPGTGTGRHSGSPPARLAAAGTTLVLRGALPMLVPLIAFPQVYLAVASNATGIFSGTAAVSGAAGGSAPSGVAAAVTTLTSAEGRVGLAVLLGIVAVVAIVLNHRPARSVDPAEAALQRSARRRSLWGDIAEVLVLALFFASVPPVLAVGLYFCLWHSLRHVVRLCLLDESLRTPLAQGRLGLAVLRFTRQAAPITLIALALLGGLYAIVPHVSSDPGSLLGLYLVLISALTLPHAVVVGLMDRAEAR